MSFAYSTTRTLPRTHISLIYVHTAAPQSTFQAFALFLHATANVKVWNQTNEYCQAQKCGLRPDNGGQHGAVHRNIQPVCLQISVFSHKNLWEKSQPRYAPYSSCKGVQVYEPRGDEGIKDTYYFYCSARFKNSSFSLHLQKISCQLFVCGARVCRVAQLCRAHLAITKQQRADTTTTTATTQRRLFETARLLIWQFSPPVPQLWNFQTNGK